jgi:hypothetical protein
LKESKDRFNVSRRPKGQPMPSTSSRATRSRTEATQAALTDDGYRAEVAANELSPELSLLCESFDAEATRTLLEDFGGPPNGETASASTDPYRELTLAMEELKDSLFDAAFRDIPSYHDVEPDPETGAAIRASVRAVGGRTLAFYVRKNVCGANRREGDCRSSSAQLYRCLVAEAKEYLTDCEKTGWSGMNERKLIEYVLREWEDTALPLIPLRSIEMTDTTVDPEAPTKTARRRRLRE